MIYEIIQFTIAAAVIVAAATALTLFCDLFAKATGAGHLVVGSVLLASATSLPELSVNWAVIKLDLPNMAVGGLIGSSLINLGILAIADLSHSERGIVFSRKSMETSLSGVLSIAMTAVAGIGILLGSLIGSREFVGLGAVTISVLITYCLGMRLIYRDQCNHRPATTEESPLVNAKKIRTIGLSIAGLVVTAAIIILASPYAASAADAIAKGTGLGDTFVGTTFIALVTSLPEFVACIAAVRIGAMNLAIGNVFGSNAFNVLLLVPLDIVHPGALLGAVALTHVLTCLLVILVTAIIISGQLYRVESRRFFVEPDAMIVLLLVSGGLALIYFCK